jgi:hypothetical protein
MNSFMPRKAKFTAAETVRVTCNFPKDIWKTLQHRALEDEETVTDILVRLATGYVRKEKPRRKT